jgi:hypothetical protein
MNEGISKWLRYGLLLYCFGLIVSSIYSGDGFFVTVLVIGLFISLFCANKCSSWAGKIKGSVNFAYAFGFLLGLFGLFLYWIYKTYMKWGTKEKLLGI